MQKYTKDSPITESIQQYGQIAVRSGSSSHQSSISFGENILQQ